MIINVLVFQLKGCRTPLKLPKALKQNKNPTVKSTQYLQNNHKGPGKVKVYHSQLQTTFVIHLQLCPLAVEHSSPEQEVSSSAGSAAAAGMAPGSVLACLHKDMQRSRVLPPLSSFPQTMTTNSPLTCPVLLLNLLAQEPHCCTPFPSPLASTLPLDPEFQRWMRTAGGGQGKDRAGSSQHQKALVSGTQCAI